MVKNLTIGNFVLDTDKYADDTIEIRHIPSGERLILNNDGSIAPAIYHPDNLPGTPLNTGAIYFDEERRIPVWWDGDNYEWPSFVDNQDVKTTSATVTNTTSETEIYRFPANSKSLVQGRLFIIRVFGSYDTAASDDGFTFKAYVGTKDFDPTAGEGTVITNVSTPTAAVTNGPWQTKTTSTVFSEGSSGELKTHTEAAFNNNKGDDHQPSVTVDTESGSVEWVGTVTWNNAKAGNTLTRDSGYLQQQA